MNKQNFIVIAFISFLFSNNIFSQLQSEEIVTKEIYSGKFIVNGDMDTYYPVVFKYGNQNLINHLKIFRSYQDPGPDALSPTHKGGLTLEIDVNYGGWGGSTYDWRIMDLRQTYHETFAYAKHDMHYKGFVVWLRGGGFLYNFQSDKASYLQIAYSTSELIFDHEDDQYDVYAPAAITQPDDDVINAHLLSINNGLDANGNLRVSGSGAHYITDGNVGIGTTAPSAKLTVKGNILASKIEIKNDSEIPSSDYVFNEDYNLRSLAEVEQYVKENKHLPEVPSAAEFKEYGYSVGEMDDILLRKVEELTLYVIEQNKSLEKKDVIINDLLQSVEKLEQEVNHLKSEIKK